MVENVCEARARLETHALGESELFRQARRQIENAGTDHVADTRCAEAADRIGRSRTSADVARCSGSPTCNAWANERRRIDPRVRALVRRDCAYAGNAIGVLRATVDRA